MSVIATPDLGLSINEYNAELTVTAATYTINKTQALRLDVSNVPVYNTNLSLDPNTNTLNLLHGYTTNDGKITVTIHNNGNRDVTPAISVSDPDVLAVDNVPASIAANDNDSFELSVKENVPSGTHTVTLTVTTGTVTKIETFTVNIAPAPVYQMTASVDRYTSNLAYNYTDANDGKFVLTALNSGNQDLQNIRASITGPVEASSWNVQNLNSLTVGSSATMDIIPEAGLSSGTYTLTVTISSDQMTDQVLTLTVVVTSQPTVSPSPSPSPNPSPSPSPGPGTNPVPNPSVNPTSGPSPSPTPAPSPVVQVVPVLPQAATDYLNQLGIELVGQAVESVMSWVDQDGNVIEVNQFDTFVEHTLPAAGPFTTAVIIDSDGTIRHVSTRTMQGSSASVFDRGNGVYALINYEHQLTDI